jgi:hypothetical protein
MTIRRNASIFASALALAACGPSANEMAIARAMALSNAESASVATELRALAAASEADGQRIYKGKDIPTQFRVLEPLAVVASPSFTGIRLSGRVDDQVYLFLRENESGPGEGVHGELVLLKGKSAGSAVLWRD